MKPALNVFYDVSQSCAEADTSLEAARSGVVIQAWDQLRFPMEVVDDDIVAVAGELVDEGMESAPAWATASLVAATLGAMQLRTITACPVIAYPGGAASSPFGFDSAAGLLFAATRAHDAGAKTTGILVSSNQVRDDLKKMIVRQKAGAFSPLILDSGRLDRWDGEESPVVDSIDLLGAEFSACRLILYQAGLDILVNPGSGIEQLRAKVRLVFRTARLLRIPLAVSLWDGRDPDDWWDVAPHAMVGREAAAALEARPRRDPAHPTGGPPSRPRASLQALQGHAPAQPPSNVVHLAARRGQQASESQVQPEQPDGGRDTRGE